MIPKKFTLNNGLLLPSIIMGTTGFRDYKSMESTISIAIDHGVRAFDTSMFYRTGGKETEKYLGKIIQSYLKQNQSINRDDLFITTKVSIPHMISGRVEQEVLKSLRRLRTDSIDCLLIHWPFADYFISTYLKMEKLMQKGVVRSIGVSNCQVRHLSALINSEISIKPHIHQFERHPLYTANEVMDFCFRHSITMQAYSPLGKMLDDIKNNEFLIHLSYKYDKSLAQIILRWHVQQGVAPVFRSKNPERTISNIDIFDFEISPEDISKMNNLNQDYKICTESTRCPGY